MVYWPVKLRESGRVLFFRLQLWDCGENALRRFDHLLPVCMNYTVLTHCFESGINNRCRVCFVFSRNSQDFFFLPFPVFQSCKEQVDAVLFLFSFTDRTSFDDLSNQIAKWTEPSVGRVVKLVVGTKYPFINVYTVMLPT